MTGQEGAQEVQQRRVGDGVIGRKATALHQQKVVRGSIRFDLSYQARFANARFPGHQGNLPLAAFRSINEQAEGSEIMSATNQDWTNQRLIKRYSYGSPRLLKDLDFT